MIPITNFTERLGGHPRSSSAHLANLRGHAQSRLLTYTNNNIPAMQRDKSGPDRVSCQSCRAKKQRCNRVQPCSNCTDRGIECNFLVPPRKRPRTTSSSYGEAELLKRIDRLEAIVLKQGDSVDSRSERDSGVEEASRQQRIDSNVGMNGNDAAYQQRLDENVGEASSVHRKRDRDSRVLQNVGTREDALVCGFSST